MPKAAGHSSPRLMDVAKVAGVSHQTVSRVINGSPLVAEPTRQRVVEAIALLGYRRNQAARALVTQKSGVIGVVAAGLGYFGPSSTIIGLESAARAEGYSLLLASLPEQTPEATQEAVDHLIGEAVEALVVIAPHETGLDFGQKSGLAMPVVVLNSEPHADLLSAGVDHVAGARMATQHLLDLGHRRIAHVSGPLDWYQARCRVQGWADALQAAGAEAADPLVGDWTAASGYEQGRRLAADPDVTAVFVANDQMSVGVIRAMVEGGRRVPEDVSIVGFDDIPEAPFLLPPLTTVNQNFLALGRGAVDLLLAVLREEAGSRSLLIPPELVVRSSTARVAV